MQAIADTVLGFLGTHPGWLIVIAFAMGFAETMIVIALFVPSTLILVSIGALVATGQVPFWPLFLGAALGALAGSSTAWWLGWRFHGPLLSWKPFARNRRDIDRARRAIAKWGTFAVVIGHFLAPLRGPVFVLVGASEMGFRRFFAATAAGGIVWAFVTPKLGELGGHLAGWIF